MGSIGSAQKVIQVRLHPGERRIILFAGDIIVSLIALLISLVLWGQRDWLEISKAFIDERVQGWFYLLPIIWLALNIEMYDIRRAGRRLETVKGIAVSAGVSIFLYLFVFFLSDSPLPRRGVAIFIVSASLLMVAWRFAYIRIFTAPEFMRRVLVIGAGRAGTTLVKVICEIKPPPFFLVGLIDDDPHKHGIYVDEFPVLGGSRDLMALIERENVTDLIFAISNEMNLDMFQAILQAEEAGIEVTTMPVAYESLLGRVPIFLLRSDWVLRSFVDHVHVSGLYEASKRLMDIAGGLVGTLLLAVVTPFIALAIWIESGWPVFYTQNRMGRHAREYTIIKFRTMRDSLDKQGRRLSDAERITRVGKILRKSHLDESPQFINILRGEMSLVGPRAEISQLVVDLQDQVPFYRARLLVKPGLTGWAQVNFGYASTAEQTAVKLEYDLYYIKHRNLLLDVIILLRTFGTVFGFRGQ